MKGSFFQRHLVEESFSARRSWSEQAELSFGAKPTNAEYEPWTLDLGPEANGGVNGVDETSLELAKKAK